VNEEAVDGAITDNVIDKKLLELTTSLKGLEIQDTNWQELLSGVAFAMNNHIHAAILTSPFVFLFGQ
jgi:hypothetical protein